MFRALLFCLFCVLMLTLIGCSSTALKPVPSVELAITQALERVAPKATWRILAVVNQGSGEHAVVYEFGGAEARRYAVLSVSSGGWENVPIHPDTSGVALAYLAGNNDMLGYVGGVVFDDRVESVEMVFPWGRSAVPVRKGSVLTRIDFPASGRPNAFGTPIPFRLIGLSGEVIEQGSVPYPKAHP